jgi:hypothetical protein
VEIVEIKVTVINGVNDTGDKLNYFETCFHLFEMLLGYFSL